MGVWIIILLLLLFGLVLMIVEVIFIPGTTIFGIFGFIAALIGIYLSFRHLGNSTGLSVLTGFALITLVALYFSFKTDVWRRFALNTSIESRVNDDNKFLLSVGDEGKAISALRPSGKAEFNNNVVEVHTMGTFLDVGCTIRVVRLDDNKIFVEMV
jgi:membrane-bound ClpP family serine protease